MKVQTSLLPFKTTFTTVSVKNCKTLQDVINTTVPFNFADSKLVVTHNGDIIDCEHWEVTSIKEHDLIGLNFIPMGGGRGGGKNTIMMVGVIAAAVITAGAAAAAYGAVAASSFGAALGTIGGVSVTGALAYGAVMVGGSMLLTMAQSALMSTPKQSGRVNNPTESTTSFIEGARNAIDKYGIVPINLGTNRMFPKLAASVYTESSGNNQYVRQLFTYGYGKVLVADRKFGETNVADFTEVEFEDKLNGDLNTGVNLYSNDVYQQAYNVALTNQAGYIVRTTQSDTDEAVIDIDFQGLCRYADNGSRNNATVEFEIQYAPTGTQDWSVGSAGIQTSQSQSLTLDLSNSASGKDGNYFIGFHSKTRTDTFIVLDTFNGIVRTVQNSVSFKSGVVWPTLSSDEIVLGYIRGGINSSRPSLSQPLVYVDNHNALIPTYINSLNDFKVTCNLSDPSNVTVTVSGGYLKGTASNLKITAATSQALRKSKRIIFPQRGQYDIRIKRLTADSNSSTLINKSYLTAIKSVKYINPVNFENISGTAMRMKATDQLSGAVDSYNALVSTYVKGYNPNTGEWDDDIISSNPADIFRYVLQSPAFAKALTDDKIDLDKLAEWWVYCDSLDLTYDRIIDYDTSVDDILNDICAAGVATLSKVDNVYSVIIDNERPIIKGMVTPRNSWDYKGNITYPELPHALRIEFRNKNAGYETDERIVFADGYNESNATLYERLQFSSCTNPELAYWYGRRYFATALLQPETHTFKMDFEHMTFNRGDRITLVNDVILVGVGQGRIKELLVDDIENPTNVIGFTIDDELNIPSAVNNLAVRIRDDAVTQGYKYHLLQDVIGVTNEFTFATPVPYANAPAVGSLCAFVEDGKELDLIITGIKPNKDQSASITAVDYAPARFEPLGVIPEFNSNITLGADFYKPNPPVLMSEIQTDESVMIRNSDGSITSVAVIPLVNTNENDVDVTIRVKKVNTTEWYVPTTLKRDKDEIVITGLQDGEYYDFDIRYQRQSGLQLMSDSLIVNNVLFVGGSTPPGDVQNFRVSVTNGLGLFTWSAVSDLDISHYVIRYSGMTSNVGWDNAQVSLDHIVGTSITNVIHKGTYLIKAVDYYGNESINATTIVSNDSGAYENVVEEFIEDSDWEGSKEHVVKNANLLELQEGYTEGYYYFENQSFDLGEVYDCSLVANVYSLLEKRNRIRDVTNNIRSVTTPIRNIGSEWTTSAQWFTELQMNLSSDGTTWSGWQPFIASQLSFRYIKFRLYMRSEDSENFKLRVSICRVTVDMPDRYESGEDIEITNANVGGVVQYSIPFRNNPSVNITIQDGAVDDRLEFIQKNNEGFTIKIFNATLNSYVKRSFDFIAAGYGKIV